VLLESCFETAPAVLFLLYLTNKFFVEHLGNLNFVLEVFYLLGVGFNFLQIFVHSEDKSLLLSNARSICHNKLEVFQFNLAVQNRIYLP